MIKALMLCKADIIDGIVVATGTVCLFLDLIFHLI